MNTTGAMLGSAIGGLFLLPLAGVEYSFFILSATCGFTALITAYAQQLWKEKNSKLRIIGGLTVCTAALLIFPFGFMKNFYLDLTLPSGILNSEKRVAYKEGLSETIQYLQRNLLQKPIFHRLVTNSLTMSGTNLRSKRYMKFFVYLPVALNQHMEDALLICYGCGSTAKALTDTSTLQHIDFVDISKDVFEMNNVVYPDPITNPINDPRVNIHVEDGRFFLATTGKSYDLITAEPPPPINTGVVNLYTQEYFELLYNRLKPGGIVTYWLPVYQLEEDETKAILKAFCNAFPSCSLWTGAELDWMMVGIKDPLVIGNEEQISKQWKDPKVLDEMQSLGFVEPSQLGAFFIADGDQIQKWIGDTPPLRDNYPKRLSADIYRDIPLGTYYSYMAPDQCRNRFNNSRHINSLLPEVLLKKTQPYFPLRKTIDNLLAQRMPEIFDLHHCLNNQNMDLYIPWAFRSDQFSQHIINQAIETNSLQKSLNNEDDLGFYRHFAARACLERNYSEANRILGIAAKQLDPKSPSNNFYYSYRAYLYYIEGKIEKAKQILVEYADLDPSLKTKRNAYAGQVFGYLSSLGSINTGMPISTGGQ